MFPLILILAACSAQPPQVTATLSPTLTLPPPTFTATPPPTLTAISIPVSPTPTGPSPEEIAQDITALNAEWNGVLSIDPETFEITSKVGEGAPVEGMKFLENGKIEITFWSDGLGREFTQQIDPSFIDFRYSDGVARSVENIVGAFTLSEDGLSIERVMAQDDGGETSVPLRTPAELNQMMLEDHSDAPGADKSSLEKADELKAMAYESGMWVLGTGGHTYIKIGDLYAKINPNEFWWSNNDYQ
ncbi:MAG: hypothetical protein AABZ00_18720 [Chloroflexota bacterium]